MEKSPETKKHYWGIVQFNATVFEGSFNQCWKRLVEKFGHYTLAELDLVGIRITRIG